MPPLRPASGPAASGLSRASPRDVADFGHREEAPLQCLILPIGLAQSQGGSRLHHLIAQVERVRRVGDAHLCEKPERVGVAQQMLIIECVDHAALGEDPPVRVADPPLELGEVVDAELGDLGIAEHHEAGLDVLRQGSSRARRDGPVGGPGRSRGPTTAPS